MPFKSIRLFVPENADEPFRILRQGDIVPLTKTPYKLYRVEIGGDRMVTSIMCTCNPPTSPPSKFYGTLGQVVDIEGTRFTVGHLIGNIKAGNNPPVEALLNAFA